MTLPSGPIITVVFLVELTHTSLPSPWYEEAAMLVHVFSDGKSQYAFTSDSTGANLPDEGRSWQHRKTTELRDTDKRIGMDSKQAIQAIQTKGYFIFPAEIGNLSG